MAPLGNLKLHGTSTPAYVVGISAGLQYQDALHPEALY